MSRLRDDVNAMQEFLETYVISVGDLVLPTLSILPVMFVVRIVCHAYSRPGSDGRVCDRSAGADGHPALALAWCPSGI